MSALLATARTSFQLPSVNAFRQACLNKGVDIMYDDPSEHFTTAEFDEFKNRFNQEIMTLDQSLWLQNVEQICSPQ